MRTFGQGDSAFTDAVSVQYERYLVPLIFEPYAPVMTERLASASGVSRVLEIAAGTGVLTRALAERLPGPGKPARPDASPGSSPS